MRLLPRAIGSLTLAAATLVAGTPKPYTIEQFLDTVSFFGASFSSDESKILVSSNQSGIYNAYAIAVSGGAPQPLTQSGKDSTFAVSFFPKDNRILFSHDQGGNELTHLYVRELDGSERDLISGEKTKAEFAGWKRDESAFYYLSNGRDPKYFDLYSMDITRFEHTLLYKDTTGYQFGGISGDGKFIAFSKPKTTTDSDIFLYDTRSHQMTNITPHAGEISNNPAAFAPDSHYLYYLTNEGSDFTYLARYELSTGKKETVEKKNWDIVFTDFSRNGKYRAVGINEDARTKIEVYTEAGARVALPELPGGEITSVTFSRSETEVAFYFNGDRSPSNLYIYNLDTKEARKLTSSLNPALDPNDLVEGENIRYKSFDGMEIPAILFKPHQASVDNKAPALVWVHGGPGGQTRRGYSGIVQYFVNHGYVILGVNNRGSSGYGKEFFMADDRKHGHEPLWDCVQAKKFLDSLGYVDPAKIGIMGGSYGGYMTLAALTLQPKEFAVGVDLFGISNWVRTLESIPSWWEAERAALYKEIGDPKADHDMLEAVSPLFHVDQIQRPLMILQGANDPRVIQAESDDMVAAVRKKGGIVEYVVFSDEGHGFAKKANQIKGYSAVLVFLDKYLKNSS